MTRWLIISFFIISYQPLFGQTSNWIENLLRDRNPIVDRVLDSFEYYKVQIKYTQIDRDQKGNTSFTEYSFGIDDIYYRYPASTVKLPVALLALEELNKLPQNVNMNTPMITGADRDPQTPAQSDTTTGHGYPCVAQYVKKILLVSDNDAYNRLYEFLGQEKINASLWRKGYIGSKIVHRLSAPNFSREDNCWINPIYFLAGDTFTINRASTFSCIDQDLFFEIQPYENLQQGIGYINSTGDLVNTPFDFKYRNLFTVNSLHRMIHSIFFEESMWDLTREQRALVIKSMGMRPAESTSPSYNYPDNYCTFFIYGEGEHEIPDHIRIFNKVGWAYGYLTDGAYIVDFKNNVEFILSASIYVNKDGIFNDDVYEYESIGLPFLSKVGQIIYEYELKRARRVEPDLKELEKLFIE
jgi:hypothetical protein